MEPYAETSRMGKVVVCYGRSQYINSTTWRNLEDYEVQNVSVEEGYEKEEPEIALDSAAGFPSDPLTGAFIGYQENLLHYHPRHEGAMILWNIHIENMELFAKCYIFLHRPGWLGEFHGSLKRIESKRVCSVCSIQFRRLYLGRGEVREAIRPIANYVDADVPLRDPSSPRQRVFSHDH